MFLVGDIVNIKSDYAWVEDQLDVMKYDLQGLAAKIVAVDEEYYTLRIPDTLLPHGQDTVKFSKVDIDECPNDHFDIISTPESREDEVVYRMPNDLTKRLGSVNMSIAINRWGIQVADHDMDKVCTIANLETIDELIKIKQESNAKLNPYNWRTRS